MCHACIYMCTYIHTYIHTYIYIYIYIYSIWARKNAKAACLLITRPTAHQEIVITRGNYLRRVFSSSRKQCDVVWYSNSSKLAESINTFLRFLNFYEELTHDVTSEWFTWLSFLLSCCIYDILCTRNCNCHIADLHIF